MNKVQLNDKQPETKSEEIIKNSKKQFDVVDKLGRKIVVGRPSVYDSEIKIFSLVDDSNPSPQMLFLISKYMYVKSIDGVPVNLSSKLELKALMEELGYEGRNALMEALIAHFPQDIGILTDQEEEIKK